VHDRVDAFDRFAHTVGLLYAALAQLDARQRREVPAVRRGSNESAHVVAARRETLGHVPSEEAAGPCDEHLHAEARTSGFS
jgi:hypothetical protein